ncbi:MAG: hypothetical protein ACOVVK_20280 [Elsteraceae bacterium]
MLDALETQYPIIEAKNLTSPLFKTLMRRHSCVMVRGLLGMVDALKLRAIAAETYQIYDATYEATKDGAPPAEQNYLHPDAYVASRSEMRNFRNFGSLLLSFCPMAAGSIIPILSHSVVRPCVEDYFGAPIGLSVNSSSVRLSERASTVRRVFHQDGNFLGGEDAETINCWIALDPCGVNAPSMEVYPQRVGELLPAGEEGSIVPWEIDEATVYGRLGKENAWIPEFRPGDAFLFDHTHVHRTHATPTMTKDRFALECWMFPIKERYRKELLVWLG